MARTIGSVEILVNADTHRLYAQLTSGAKKGGEAAAKEINKELRNLRANIKEIDGKKEAEVARLQIENALRDLDVTLDFTKARAALKEFEENAERVRILLNVGADLSEQDIEEIRLDFAGFKKRIEADKIRLRLELDAEGVYDDAAAAQATLEHLDVAWRVNLDGLDKAVEEADAAKFAIEKRKVQLQFTAAASLAEEIVKVEAAKRAMEKSAVQLNLDFATALGQGETALQVFLAKQRNIELGMDLDLAATRAALEVEVLTLEETAPVIDLEAKVHANQAALALQMKVMHATMQAGLRDFDAHVDVHYDKAQKAKDVDAPIEKNFKELGDKSGKAFGGSLLTGDNTKLMLLAGLSMGDALASGLSGALGAATSVISSGINAIGGAAGAAAPLVAGFAATLGAVIIGSQGVGDAVKAISKEFENAAKEGRAVDLTTGEVAVAMAHLAPSAQKAVLAFTGLKDEFRELKLNVQEQLFKDFDKVITTFGEKTLPKASKGLQILAGEANEFGKRLGEIAAQTDFEKMAQDIAPALDDAFDAGAALVETLEPFLTAASPAAEKLAEMIERAAEGMRDWVSSNPEAIASFLDNGVDSLERWAELLGSTVDLLATVFSAGQESGDSFVASLDRMVERWDAFLESTEGQHALEEFFTAGKGAMDAMKPVLEGLKEAFKILITPETTERFANLAQSIGDALPSLGRLIELIGELQLAAGFADLLSALEPVFWLIQQIPDEFMQVAGTAIVVASAMSKVVAGLKAIGLVSKTVGMSNPYILAIGAAVTVATVAFAAFSDETSEATKKAEEFSDNLIVATDELIRNGDASRAASTGLDAFNNALDDTGGSKKLQTSLGLLNNSISNARQITLDMATDSHAALTDLATDYGLPIEPAERLADMVGKTQQNFGETGREIMRTQAPFNKLAADLGMTFDELFNVASAMEYTQDTSKSLIQGLEDTAEAELAAAKGGDVIEQSALKAAEAWAVQNGVAGDLLPTYDKYLELLKIGTTVTDDSTDSLITYGDAMADLGIAEAIAAEKERQAELKKTRDAAFDAWQEEIKLGDATKDAAAKASAGLGINEDYAEGLIDIGEAADKAADAADSFLSVLDKLLSPAITVEETLSDIEQAFDDFDLAIQGGQEALDKHKEALDKAADAQAKYAKAAGEKDPDRRKEIEAEAAALQKEADALQAESVQLKANARTLDLHTEAGRDNREMLRQTAESMTANIAAMISTGQGTDVIIKKADEFRAALVKEAEAFGATKAEAETYANTLLGTPQFLDTIVKTPGLTDALLNAKDLTLLFDKAGNPVITEFEALGLEATTENAQALKLLLEGLAVTTVQPTVDSSSVTTATTDVQTLKTEHDSLDSVVPVLDVDTTKVVDARDVFGGTAIAFDDLSGTAIPEVDLAQITAAQAEAKRTIDLWVELDHTTASPLIGIDPVVSTNIGAVMTGIEGIDQATAVPKVSFPPDVIFDIQAISGEIIEIGQADVKPKITIPPEAIIDIEDISGELKKIDEFKANPTIDFSGLTSDMDAAGAAGILSMGGQAPKIKLDIDKSALDEAQAQLATMGTTTVMPVVLVDPVAEAGIQAIQDGIDGIGTSVVEPTIEFDPQVALDLANYESTLDDLDDTTVSPDFKFPGLNDGVTKVGTLQTTLDKLPKSKTIQIAIDAIVKLNTGTGVNAPRQPGTPGSMAGELIRFPTVRQVGERGMREAIIPMDLPLNRVNPEVRALAALVRGEGGATIKMPSGKTVNNYLTVTPLSADPEAVANQLINRSVAMART